MTSVEVGAAVRVLLATLSFTAGAIHLVMAPSHADESMLEGAGFLAAGWLQIGSATLLFTQTSRLLLRATAGLNVALIGIWVISRSFGLPFGAHAGHAEQITAVDLTTVGIEMMLVLTCAALLVRPDLVRSFDQPALFAGLFVPVGVVALASIVLLSPSARDHASGAHGDHDAASGHSHGGGDDLGLSALQNGHQHGSGEVALDPRTQALLDDELDQTQELVDRYPTIADAEAAGYRRAGPFSPGLGTHYVNYGGYVGANADALVGAHESMVPVLIYDGLEPDAPIAGFMYMVLGGSDDEPEGFVGPNDHWHYHTNTCLVFRDGGIEAPLGADRDDVSQELCDQYGGRLIANTGYMVHVWTVSGYESERGTFSEVSPALTCPDGTYYTKPIEELGWSTTLCAGTDA